MLCAEPRVEIVCLHVQFRHGRLDVIIPVYTRDLFHNIRGIEMSRTLRWGGHHIEHAVLMLAPNPSDSRIP